MIQKILDLHIHSRYSRACSKNLELQTIAKTCEIRGIDIVSTGDFTHPKWFQSIKELLEEDTSGLYRLKENMSPTRFIIGTEVASIKKHKDKTRRVHHLLFAPNLEVAEKFNRYLTNKNFNLTADGRPILGITSKEILETMLEIDERMMMVPAHAWTPWFGIFGSKGGYDSLEQAFDELSPHVVAIETGLSSDPPMNWRIPALDGITLISNSDAHSPMKLGREANVFSFFENEAIDYDSLMEALKTKNKEKFLHTIEFYPEEGKYHEDGHAACEFSCSPKETKKYNDLCPKCKKPLVKGVLNRVEELAGRTEEEARNMKIHIPYKSIVPLIEIVASTLSVGVSAKSCQKVYTEMIRSIGNEFFILLSAPLEQIASVSGDMLARAIERVRTGNIVIRPGYDGVFGVVKVFEESPKKTKQIGFQL